MAPSSGTPIRFIVPGQEGPSSSRGAAANAGLPMLPAGLTRGRLKQSVQVGARRGGHGEVRLIAVPGEDVVVFQIAGGPALVLHPEHARDLMLAQQGEIKRSRSAKGAVEPGPDEIKLPVQLQWQGLEPRADARGQTRGVLGDVLLAAVHVITGIGTGKAADFVADKVVERFDAHVDEGLYQLNQDALTALKGASLAIVSASTTNKPLLVFIHGTFSDTSGTFGKLWVQYPNHVRTLFETYANRVYGLDHATLGMSPIANALTLAKALPPDTKLHLVTHSRGGLVAEVLARVCAMPDLTSPDLQAFAEISYADQQRDLKALAQVVKQKRICVERIVRVACPARGTLLASKRLDAYISIIKWTLELAGIPVAPGLITFLGEVAQYRADPMKIPGLAAQIPDSPLVKWLQVVEKPIEGQLRVVAGDIEGDSVMSWLKTLLADAFFWTDNDLVVHTRSMYGGLPRAAGASFVFDQGGKVSHFNYFANEGTVGAIVEALVEEAPRGFRTIGPLSWAGESSTGLRAMRRMDKKASDRPSVFLLPGILGSNLKVGGQRIWLGRHFLNGIQRLKYIAGKQDSVQPDGPISVVYDRLAEFLSESHEVVEFAFDWRKPIELEAQRLADAVQGALVERARNGQPVRLIAHSMGGLVARVMQLERPEVWKLMLSRVGARILMLGTPNGGSWAPMQVLSGDETFGNTLVAFGGPFQGHDMRQLMAEFPGLLQLQAGLLDDRLGLNKSQTWKELAAKDLAVVDQHSWWHRDKIQLDEYTWGLPSQQVLDQAVALRKRLDVQRDDVIPHYSDKLLLVTGKAAMTPDGYDFGEAGLFYREAIERGDGRVTLASAQLPGVRTWTVNCEHGNLPSQTDAFKAYRELLETGTTDQLELVRNAEDNREAAVTMPAHVPSRPSRARTTMCPPEMTRDLLSREEAEPQITDARRRAAALGITVVNGDLKFVRHPLMIGHYRSIRLTGTEHVMNKLVDGVMEESLKVGLYPDVLGSHQVFLNTRHDPEVPRPMPWPEAVIVVGIGEEGKLRATDLVQAVRQATIAWSQRLTVKAEGAPVVYDLAATLIGSGGMGISAGQSAQLIAEGVREANQRLAECNWPSVGHLHLIEIYLDRASEAWRALQVQTTATPAYYQITETIQCGPGALRHTPDQGYRGVDYDFISVLSQKGEQGDALLSYTLDTKRARTEVRAQATQGRLVRNLVISASNDRNTDTGIRRALFRLLVPVELETFFGGTSEMVIELDQHTSGIPWELLDTDVRGGGDKRPWAIRAKLLRRLRTADFRSQTLDAGTEESVLVIGEPECDSVIYPRLPNARQEAEAVVKLLVAPGALDPRKVTALISPDDPDKFGPDARAVMTTLLARDWRIVHISGHGEPPEKLGPEPRQSGDPEQRDGDPRGVVLSDQTFLGPREIRAMRVVPELVFVNCCHLAARNIAQLADEDQPQLGQPYDRPRFAATVAEELIKSGVRCVIAAGWAVDDAAAKVFATTFYGALLRQRRFIEAMGEAREAAMKEGGNTWAAYQCYGDPDWMFRRQGADAQRPTLQTAERFSGIASSWALELALDTLAVESQYQNASPDEQRTKIRYLEAQFGNRWGSIGFVAEAFGKAWKEVGETKGAVAWYEKALAANDGTASIKAVEQLRNLQVRQAWESVKNARDRRDESRRRLDGMPLGRSPATVKARTAQKIALECADRVLNRAARTSRQEINDTITALQKLAAVQSSSERASLLGSAYKRLSMIEEVLGRSSTKSIRNMERAYHDAENRARASTMSDSLYPALNRMAADLILNVGRVGWKGFDSASLSVIRQSLEIKVRDNPDFWSAASLIDLQVYTALAQRKLTSALVKIQAEYEDLHSRVTAAWMWDSVYDQMQFVLPKYKVSTSEKRAAYKLLKRLEAMAGPHERMTSGRPPRGVP